MFDPNVAIVATLVLALDSNKARRKRRKWSKGWYLKCDTYGHLKLLNELRATEPDDFRNFLRMDAPSFDELLGLVESSIRKQDTIMRPSIPASERLSITLRFLASGNSYEDLKFLSARSHQAIGKLVNETCEAIIDCLKRQLIIKVRWLITSKHWYGIVKLLFNQHLNC